ncbi:MAG: Fe-S cluster protector protein [Chloroflexi bacterium]|nr:Fe-S cluster protector protein [Chloroflexota bacterium]
MTETHDVACSRCGRTAAGIAEPPVAGDVGQLVYDHVCRECWSEWFEQSVNVINHHGLNPALREHRLQLYEIMKEFLNIPGRTPSQ